MKIGIQTIRAAGAAAAAIAAATVLTIGGSARANTATASNDSIAPAASTPLCTAPAKYSALAARLSRDITAAMHGRHGHIAVRVEDVRTGVECRYNEGSRSHSASVMKVTILAALLYWHQQTHTSLSSTEKHEATLMIEQSDNNAATYLWDKLGESRVRNFLKAATMTETVLAPSGAWGLTNITARDELQLMRLLTGSNSVLTSSSRAYEVGLMNHVIPYDYWGITAGVPSGLTVYVKNGWLPDPELWVVNSIGAFTSHKGVYKIVVLSQDNPAMADGIALVQGVATVVNRALAPG